MTLACICGDFVYHSAFSRTNTSLLRKYRDFTTMQRARLVGLKPTDYWSGALWKKNRLLLRTMTMNTIVTKFNACF